jgi:uncharacterized membrane protein YeaQ/YmgE (transglycosylase-associated protein family)
MEILALIVSLLFTGIVFGALGRLAIPGPNPMSIGATILAGIAGSFLGALVAVLLGARTDANLWLLFVLQVLGAALVVWLISRRRSRPAVY